MSSLDAAAGSPSEEWTVLAHVLRPQGRKGEVLAELMTDFPDQLEGRKQLYLAPPGFQGEPVSLRPAHILGHWLPVGRNHGRIVLAVEGVDSIESAEALCHLDLIVPSTARIELPDDEAYIADLIDCTVFDQGAAIGIVTAVDFPSTPDGSRRLEAAAPLLTVVTPQGEEVLVPYVQNFLLAVSIGDRRIDMRLPAGLVDLNR